MDPGRYSGILCDAVFATDGEAAAALLKAADGDDDDDDDDDDDPGEAARDFLARFDISVSFGGPRAILFEKEPLRESLS